MKSNLFRILFTTDNKKLKEKQKRRRAKADAERKKAKMERKLWELAEEYEEEE